MKYFALLKILYPFIKSFVKSFVGISLASLDRSFVTFVHKIIRSFSFFSAFATLLSLLKSGGIDFSLSISILSTSYFKLAKASFSAKLGVSKSAALLKSTFVA